MSWTPIAEFWIPGEPKAQPRVKGRVMLMKSAAAVWGSVRSYGDLCRAIHRMATVQIYTPAVADEWRKAIKLAAGGKQPVVPLKGPVRVAFNAYLPRPKYMDSSRYPAGRVLHDKRPDIDNLAKPVLDVMTEGGWWGDDGQVRLRENDKFWHAKGGQPGMKVWVEVWQEQPALLGGGA